jgi:16S rRNA (guanine(966)-N(2))-methyltransferase RsmD
VRITGGQWRSRILKGPGRSVKLRPTPDALRERVFAVLGDRVLRCRFLDLFAGTGAVGLEALSRGADEAVLVENHHSAANIIEANRSSLCDEPARCRLIRRTAQRAVLDLARRREVFHIGWADPPFDDWLEGLKALVAAFDNHVIDDDGIACLECPERADVTANLPDWLEVERDLPGGASRVVLLRRRR